jgi:hypothetical protein
MCNPVLVENQRAQNIHHRNAKKGNKRQKPVAVIARAVKKDRDENQYHKKDAPEMKQCCDKNPQRRVKNLLLW